MERTSRGISLGTVSVFAWEDLSNAAKNCSEFSRCPAEVRTVCRSIIDVLPIEKTSSGYKDIKRTT